MYHLAVIPKAQRRAFNFPADTSTPIPTHLLELAREDAPAPDTTPGLEGFRTFLSDSEADLAAGCKPYDFELCLADLRGNRNAAVVPLASDLYAHTKISRAFAAWRDARPTRAAHGLNITCVGDAFAITLATREEA